MFQNATIPPRVFIVDDEAVLRFFARATLEKAGCDVEDFVRADACLARLKELEVDAVLLDLGIEGMSGAEALQMMRHRHPRVPVIIVSSRREPSVIAATIARGAYDYIVKPIDPIRLVATVRHAVEHHRISLQLAALDSKDRGQRRERTSARRERHRKGARRASHPPKRRARRLAVCRDQLCRDIARSRGVGVVWA